MNLSAGVERMIFRNSDIPNFWIKILQSGRKWDGELLVCDQATCKDSKNV